MFGSATRQTSSLRAILALTFVASIGTGILWSGLSFIAKHAYGFSEERNFVLYIVTALAYVGGAFAAGPLTRLLTTTLSPRGIIAAILIVQAIVAAFPLVFAGEWVLWIVACATSVLAALLWPIVESYLTAGRHGQSMRSAMGWWNITWTSAVAIALIAMAPFLSDEHPQRALWAIVVLVPLSVMALPLLVGFTRSPGEHDEEKWKASITPEYTYLLHSARVLLPVSYLLIGAVSPLMPYLLSELRVELIGQTPMTATWMIARVIAITLMWRLHFWHGRWGALLLGGTSMALGFAMIVISPNVATMITGLAILGAGQGIVYYAALYYAMSVGRAAVDAGGTHEGLIGLGYAAGPIAALGGMRLSATIPALSGAAGITAVVTLALVIAAIPAIAPYRRAVETRRATEGHGEEQR